LGNPVRFVLTGGETSDFKCALTLLDGLKAQAVMADKGYDADYIVQAALKMGADPVIPPKSNRLEQRQYDSVLYKERNHVERLFNKIKNFLRVATRYDKTASSFLGFVHLAAICIWLN
jgi:transposase